MMEQWYRLWGAPIGFFPAWTDYGWFYGTQKHMAELLGYLMVAGGTSYTFAAATAEGVPVAPIIPPVVQPPGQQWPFPVPSMPGLLQLPGGLSTLGTRHGTQ